ncbi:DNA-binding protein [Kitasatospora sp. MMS16-BH015]|uniref:helix-turn-helix domain-containing protein n=1 Tax=Kitasatospora sp. MMS16-BH015 TaxID=2018025 RepID=UPI000CA307C7|nr:helix-turn-helix domain-containing protein [Kitasatospora sp. MMS16-BH015]AUG76285.1 DNA-binding protein [Kitasatospora sp. MMS16-BH015]
MTAGRVSALTFPEIFNLPVSVDMRTAAGALGVCLNTAYRWAAEGTFPCRVLRPGWRYLVPTAGLMRALEIESRPVQAVDLMAGSEYAARWDQEPLAQDLLGPEDFT